MMRWLLAVSCLLAPTGCALQAAAADPERVRLNPADELLVRRTILTELRQAIDKNDFAGLSAMEHDFRSSRARTPSGMWKLKVFHSGVQTYLADGLVKEGGCTYRKAPFVQQWAAAEPRSPAPAITDAALRLEQAWCFRGRGFADSVAPEAWPKFNAGVAAASAALDKHKAIAADDPEFYTVAVSLARVQNVGLEPVRKLVDTAAAKEPGYPWTYSTAAWSFLPQWGGSYPALESFVRDVSRDASAKGQEDLYVRIFRTLDECGCQIITSAADWPTLRQSMRDVYSRYPVAWNGEYFAGVACRMKDVEEGRRYIRSLHPEAADEGSFVALFYGCDVRARTGM
jgi:hypothetical protein